MTTQITEVPTAFKERLEEEARRLDEVVEAVNKLGATVKEMAGGNLSDPAVHLIAPHIDISGIHARLDILEARSYGSDVHREVDAIREEMRAELRQLQEKQQIITDHLSQITALAQDLGFLQTGLARTNASLEGDRDYARRETERLRLQLDGHDHEDYDRRLRVLGDLIVSGNEQSAEHYKLIKVAEERLDMTGASLTQFIADVQESFGSAKADADEHDNAIHQLLGESDQHERAIAALTERVESIQGIASARADDVYRQLEILRDRPVPPHPHEELAPREHPHDPKTDHVLWALDDADGLEPAHVHDFKLIVTRADGSRVYACQTGACAMKMQVREQ